MPMPAAAPLTLPELMEQAEELWLQYDDEDVSHKDLLIGAMDLLGKFQSWAENTGLTE